MRAGPLALQHFLQTVLLQRRRLQLPHRVGARVAAGAGAIAHANLVEVSNVGKEFTDAVSR